MRTHHKLLAAASALAMVGGGAALAQSAPPTVTVDLAATRGAIGGADALGSGPTTLRLTSRRGERFALVVELKPGVTPTAFGAAVRRLRSPAGLRRYGRSIASGPARPGGAYTTTVTLAAATYGVVTVGDRGGRLVGTFTAGATPTGAVAPEPAAVVGMRDFRFEVPATLPANGIVRWENRGRQFHEGVVFRLRRGVDADAVVRKLRRGGEPRSEIAGMGTGVGLVDRGSVNDVATRMAPGTYVLACFLPDERSRRGRPHVALGMAQKVRVR
jgi:hypothetical protein